MQEVIAPAQPSGKPDPTFLHAAIFIVVGILSTTLAQPQLLGRIPIQNLLKNELHADRAANAAFFFWIGLAWYFKPFAGILTDSFPLFGSRRRSYILIAGSMATLGWAALAFTPHVYGKLLAVTMVLDAFMVLVSTVVGGYLVETAQAIAGSGRLTSLRMIVDQSCFIINGPAAGFLASIPFVWTTGACGGIMFLIVPATIFFLHERERRIAPSELLGNARKQLVKIGTAKTMWAAAGLMALFYIAPGISTAIFYKQQNDLHMNTEAQGMLTLLSGIGGVLAALGYSFLCRRLNLRQLLMGCMTFATFANLGYLFYSSVGRARMIESFNGFGYTLAELALMDLAIRATPAGSEGLGYSIMMSVRNLALFGTDWIGSKMMDAFHVQFNSLVLSNAATTLITVPLVLLLPRMIVGHRDAELYEEPAAPVKAPL
jgi:hypothetical protein